MPKSVRPFTKASICRSLLAKSKAQNKRKSDKATSSSASNLTNHGRRPKSFPFSSKFQNVETVQSRLDQLISVSAKAHSNRSKDQPLPSLNQALLNRLLQWCKLDPIHLHEVLCVAYTQPYLYSTKLTSRFWTLRFLNELFQKSFMSRSFISHRLMELIQHTISPKPMHHKLALSMFPGSQSDKEMLQKVAVDFLIEWYESYSDDHFQLALALDYLQHSLHVDIQSHLNARKNEALRHSLLMEERANEETRFLHQWREMAPTLHHSVSAFEASVKLLFHVDSIVADYADAFETSVAGAESSVSIPTTFNEMAQMYGLGSNAYSLTVSLPSSSGLDVNQLDPILLDQVKEYYRICLVHYLPKLSPWVSRLANHNEIQECYKKMERLCQFTRSLGIRFLGTNAEKKRENHENSETMSAVLDDGKEEEEEFEEILPF